MALHKVLDLLRRVCYTRRLTLPIPFFWRKPRCVLEFSSYQYTLKADYIFIKILLTRNCQPKNKQTKSDTFYHNKTKYLPFFMNVLPEFPPAFVVGGQLHGDVNCLPLAVWRRHDAVLHVLPLQVLVLLDDVTVVVAADATFPAIRDLCLKRSEQFIFIIMAS